MKLNARQIDTAKPKEKAYKLADGGGLYLLVKPGGGEYWRLKYRVAGKEKLLALGVYPEVTLADAPAKLEEAKRGISGGIDLMEVKREEKIARTTPSKILPLSGTVTNYNHNNSVYNYTLYAW